MGVDSIDFDTVLDLCGHEYRRIILAVLREEQRPLTLRDLTTTILKYNHQTSMSEGSSELQTRIRMSLHHVHIPKLESVGFVEYDSERQVVVPTGRFDELLAALSPILEADPEFEEPLEL